MVNQQSFELRQVVIFKLSCQFNNRAQIDQNHPLYYSTGMHFNDFNHFCSYMESFANLEKRTGSYSVRQYRLDRMKAILDHIGHPERDYRCIHVAGSKGKGSTSRLLANGIQALGHTVGLYMSPHLMDYRERFTLAGTFFTEDQLVGAANELTGRLEHFTFEDEWGVAEPTAFELYTSFAFLLFSMAQCDWAVIETGLGGRLDATNTIIPQAAVITPIELEHTAVLGNTIPLIAAEKSKIIKQGVPTFVSRQSPEAMAVFEAEALAMSSHLTALEVEVESIATHTTEAAEVCTITWKNLTETRLNLAMLGEVQAENAALALTVLKGLGLYQAGISEAALESARLPGRMERIGEQPAWYIDGAHTVQSIRHLMNSFNQLFEGKSNTVIYGALLDKDHVHMTRLLLPFFERIIVSRPGTFKKSDPEALFLLIKEEIGEAPLPRLFLEKDPVKAVELALDTTPSDSAVLCTGSFYLAGDIAKAYREVKASREQKEMVVGCR